MVQKSSTYLQYFAHFATLGFSYLLLSLESCPFKVFQVGLFEC
jgi:hypothetical protein